MSRFSRSLKPSVRTAATDKPPATARNDRVHIIDLGGGALIRIEMLSSRPRVVRISSTGALTVTGCGNVIDMTVSPFNAIDAECDVTFLRKLPERA